jgi:hypothetical protein
MQNVVNTQNDNITAMEQPIEMFARQIDYEMAML